MPNPRVSRSAQPQSFSGVPNPSVPGSAQPSLRAQPQIVPGVPSATFLLECATPESPWNAQPQTPGQSLECPAPQSNPEFLWRCPTNPRVFLECPTSECPRSAQPQSVPGVPSPRVSLECPTPSNPGVSLPREGGDARSKIIK